MKQGVLEKLASAVGLGKPPAPVALPDDVGLAKELGVAVDVVVYLRGRAAAGRDFVVSPQGIRYTLAGKETIRAALAEMMESTAGPRPPGPPPAPRVPVYEDLKVTRAFKWSTRVLAVRENNLEVVVSVKNAAHLKPGMILKKCREGEMGGWFYEGRLPRSIGEEQLFFPGKHSNENPSPTEQN